MAHKTKKLIVTLTFPELARRLDLPDDVEIVRVEQSHFRDKIEIVLQSDRLRMEVAEGQDLPAVRLYSPYGPCMDDYLFPIEDENTCTSETQTITCSKLGTDPSS